MITSPARLQTEHMQRAGKTPNLSLMEPSIILEEALKICIVLTKVDDIATAIPISDILEGYAVYMGESINPIRKKVSIRIYNTGERSASETVIPGISPLAFCGAT